MSRTEDEIVASEFVLTAEGSNDSVRWNFMTLLSQHFSLGGGVGFGPSLRLDLDPSTVESTVLVGSHIPGLDFEGARLVTPTRRRVLGDSGEFEVRRAAAAGRVRATGAALRSREASALIAAGDDARGPTCVLSSSVLSVQRDEGQSFLTGLVLMEGVLALGSANGSVTFSVNGGGTGREPAVRFGHTGRVSQWTMDGFRPGLPAAAPPAPVKHPAAPGDRLSAKRFVCPSEHSASRSIIEPDGLKYQVPKAGGGWSDVLIVSDTQVWLFEEDADRIVRITVDGGIEIMTGGGKLIAKMNVDGVTVAGR